MNPRRVLACVVLLAAAGSQAGRAQPLGATSTLFSSTAAHAEQAATDRTAGAVERSRVAHVVLERLGDEQLLLNLFSDVTIAASRKTAERRADGSTVWFGQVDGEPLSAVTFVQTDGIVQGAIRTFDGAYSVEPVGDGPDHLVRQLDLRVTPPELPPLVPPSSPAFDAVPQASFDDGSVLDVLVLYTTAARAQAGGSDAAVRARIALGITETNKAYENSRITQRVRLVGSELVGYRETGDLAEDLQRLTSESDGLMDIVHARRNAVGADLVKLVVGSTAGGACGVAWVMQNLSVAFAPYAYSVTAYPCISPNYTFGHELAHNMGTAHAPEDPNAPPVLPYAYGYKDPMQLFRTVMAYDCASGCPRVLHFSNPDALYAGKPTGTPSQQNNALALNQTAITVANFRPSRLPSDLLEAPGAFTLDTTGTTVTLSWARPATGVPTSYLVEVGTEEGLSDIATLVVSGINTSFVQPDVPPGTYFLRVRALDAYGPGPPSKAERLIMTETGRCIAPAGAPMLLTPDVSATTVMLAWNPSPTGGPVERYVIGAGTRPQLVDAAVIDTLTAGTSYTAYATPGVYFVRVAGVNGCGIGAPSSEVSVTVGPPVPGPPTGLIAGISVDRRVTLTWRPSDADGVATSFIVEAGSAPGLSDVAVLPTPGATPSFSILAAPRRYYVRVRAVNAHGTSVASEEIVLQVL